MAQVCVGLRASVQPRSTVDLGWISLSLYIPGYLQVPVFGPVVNPGMWSSIGHI